MLEVPGGALLAVFLFFLKNCNFSISMVRITRMVVQFIVAIPLRRGGRVCVEVWAAGRVRQCGADHHKAYLAANCFGCFFRSS